MGNGTDAFEHALKRSLDSYEVPFNSADWALLERELDKGAGMGRRASTGLLALLFGGGLALATTVYLMASHQDEGSQALAHQEQVSDAGVNSPPTELAAKPAVPEMAAVEAPEPGRMAAHEEDAHNAASPAGKATTAKNTSNGHAAATIPLEAAQAAAPSKTASTEIGIRPSMVEGCPGSEVLFTVQNAPDASEVKGVLWNFGDGSFSVDQTPSHVFTKAGRFEVTLSYSTSRGSLIQKPVTDVIVIHEVPEASFVPIKQDDPEKVPSVHFENKSLGGVSYLWDFGDGHTSTLRIPSHVYKTKGNYPVSLTVTNAIGCVDRTERNVKIEEDYNLHAPHAFSPNGDGLDDSFIPDALTTLGVRFHMRVHDPVTGQLLFETSDPKRPWNGRVGGKGEPCASGDYLWMVEMKDGEKLGGTYTGTVSLVR
ncbi:MAG: PKD domain-containing protein [Flavobacteriales bacterium]|nr:PKD domain-containing protein [Flavobacteriales bacterium]